MNTNMTKNVSDVDLKNDVLSALKYEPTVKTSDIGVLVKDGVVTLNGFVESYWEKKNAVGAAKRVFGVSAIADDIKIKLPGAFGRTDGDIAGAAEQQIKWSPSSNGHDIKAIVREGWVTLEGDVEWWYQKNAAENAVHFLAGVKGVSNMINIKPKLSPASIQSEIQEAFKRSASLDADEVSVSTTGNKVTLSGKVRTYTEKEEAGLTAWAAAGVMSVDNNISVNSGWFSN